MSPSAIIFLAAFIGAFLGGMVFSLLVVLLSMGEEDE